VTKSFLLPIFPLSGVIFYPNTNLPLNIFEDRYLEMIDYALSRDKAIGMIQSMDNDKLYKVGCFGKITSFDETEDGRYIINLTGKNYFNITKELHSSKKFRIVEAVINKEGENLDLKFDMNKFNKDLLIDNYCLLIKKVSPEINLSFIDKIEPITLIKYMAMSCPFSSADKQMLLETFNLNDLSNKLLTLFDFYLTKENNNISIN